MPSQKILITGGAGFIGSNLVAENLARGYQVRILDNLARQLTHRHAHVVVEANPALIPLLERNKALNAAEFQIVSGALAYGCDAVTFFLNRDSLAGSVQSQKGEAVTVPALTLHDLFERNGFQSAMLVCDIEGGEIDLVAQESQLFAERVRLFVVEVHRRISGEEAIAAMIKRLEQVGFELVSGNKVLIFVNRKFS